MWKRNLIIFAVVMLILLAGLMGIRWYREVSRQLIVGKTTYDDYYRMYPDHLGAITSFGYVASYTAEDGSMYTLTFRHQKDDRFLLTSMVPYVDHDLESPEGNQ